MRPQTPTIPAQSIPLAAPAATSLLWLWGPVLLVICINPLIQLFAGKPPVTAAFASWGPLLVLPLITAGLTLAYRRRHLQLDARQLKIASTLYSKQVPISAMRLDRARVVDFDENPGFKPALKTNGFQMPGFRAGHFRMKDGSKGFCLITDNRRVLVLPLRDGSSVLLSPVQPRALLEELKRLADNLPRA